jgi:hypothetical protein
MQMESHIYQYGAGDNSGDDSGDDTGNEEDYDSEIL